MTDTRAALAAASERLASETDLNEDATVEQFDRLVHDVALASRACSLLARAPDAETLDNHADDPLFELFPGLRAWLRSVAAPLAGEEESDVGDA